MLLVPNPEPAGTADNKVISMPQPSDCNCLRSDAKGCAEKSGEKPHKTSAAFGMEKGEPTVWNRCKAS
jgi:hypothetical protein